MEELKDENEKSRMQRAAIFIKNVIGYGREAFRSENIFSVLFDEEKPKKEGDQ
jgi:hypothetical protein